VGKLEEIKEEQRKTDEIEGEFVDDERKVKDYKVEN